MRMQIRTQPRDGTWPAGPWDDEPDYASWIDEATDLDCLAVRSFSGAWCGYVGLPPGHPDHGRDYTDLQPQPVVHGGLTYSATCRGDICHVAQPGRPDDVWWLGFDCAHSLDFSPALAAYAATMPTYPGMSDQTYRDLDYVVRETGQLAAQLVVPSWRAARP